jgi:GAF domain-containing protein
MLNRYLRTNTKKYFLIGSVFGFLFPLFATLLRMLLSNRPFNLSTAVFLQAAEPLLWIIDTAPIFLGLFAAIAGRRQDHLEELNEQLRIRENELVQARTNLEKRVEERTRELEQQQRHAEKRSRQFEALADVARSITKTKDLKDLLPQITDTISKQFGFYHVGIFLTDASGQLAVLSAANSEGGKRMMARGHQLQIGEQGIVGHVTSTGKPRIALDVGTDATFFNNPELPLTRSELALPLKNEGQIIGALDVQSEVQKAFTNEDVEILSTLADQVSLAIENSRLFEQIQKTLMDAEVITRQNLRDTWSRLPQEYKLKGYKYTITGAAPMEDFDEISLHNPFKNEIAIPINLRGEKIGTLSVQVPREERITPDQTDLVMAVAERLGLALDNSRLFDETQKRGERERIIAEITSKIGSSVRTENILKTAAQELNQLFDGAEVLIKLGKEK